MHLQVVIGQRRNLGKVGDTKNLVISSEDYRVTWNAGADWNNSFSDGLWFRVYIVPDPEANTPAGMKFISNSHLVGPYYMDTYHVTWQLWNEVRQWGVNNGYTDLPGGKKGSTDNGAHVNHPVTEVNWYDCVKWCNARSEQAGLPGLN